jgi:hypothetical protein
MVGELGILFAAFADHFLAHAATGLADLPQYNLDTGGVEGEDPDYPLSRFTRRTIERLRANRRTGRESYSASGPLWTGAEAGIGRASNAPRIVSSGQAPCPSVPDRAVLRASLTSSGTSVQLA